MPRASTRPSIATMVPPSGFSHVVQTPHTHASFGNAGSNRLVRTNAKRTDAHTLAIILESLNVAGLNEWKLRIGDLGLFRALLSAIDMPERWRERLRHQLWRPQAFREELVRLTEAPASHVSGMPDKLMQGLDPDKQDEAQRIIARYLDQQNIELIGIRTLEEISRNLARIADDQRAERLPVATANLIEGYIGVNAPARARPGLG